MPHLAITKSDHTGYRLVFLRSRIIVGHIDVQSDPPSAMRYVDMYLIASRIRPIALLYKLTPTNDLSFVTPRISVGGFTG